MKLLIEIPDKTYRMIKNNKYDYGDINIIIQNGTPLDNIRESINFDMTIEKAIEILQSLWCYKNPKYSDTDIRKALDIAINSLEKFNDNTYDIIRVMILNEPTMRL